MPKAEIDIERLLSWTYRDELPKQRFALDGASISSSYENVMAYGAMGGIDIDESPRLPAALGAPHPDAFVVEAAVRALMAVKIEWDTNGRALMGDFADLVIPHARLCFWSADMEPLVVMHARMGTRPDWRHEPFECVRMQDETGRNGKAIVVGRDPATHRYVREPDAHGAYARCPLVWKPDPAMVAEARMEYAAWHAGLCELAESLGTDSLSAHVALPPACSAEPWLTPDPQVNILDGGTAGKPQPAARSARARMLAPLSRGQHGPVRHLTARGT
jgi:hypothetical protein